MAGYRGHLAGGAVAAVATSTGLAALPVGVWVGSVFATALPPQTGEEWAVLGGVAATSVMFALWPDVDTDSKGQRLFGALLLIADLAFIIGERFRMAALVGLIAILPMIGRHRGWTHTWWAALLVPLPIAAIPYVYMPEAPFLGLPFYAAATAGYASHLLIDAFS